MKAMHNTYKTRAPTPGQIGTIQMADNFGAAMKRLMCFLSPHKAYIVLAICLAAVGVVCNVLATDLVREMIEAFNPRGNIAYRWLQSLFVQDDYFTNIAILLIAIYSVGFIFSYTQSFIMSSVIQKNSCLMRGAISSKINRLPLKYYDQHQVGDTLSCVTNDVDSISQSLNQSSIILISSTLTLIFSLVMMLWTDWRMTITVVVSSLIGFATVALIMKTSQKYFQQQQESLGEMNGFIEETYSGHNIVKLYCAEGNVFRRYSDINNKLQRSAWKAQAFSGVMLPLMIFIGNLGYISVCIVGTFLLINDNLSGGVAIIAAFLVYARLFSTSMGQMTQSFVGLQTAAAASERVFKLLDREEMSDESHKAEQLDRVGIRGFIVFKDVSFGYSPDRPIIKDFSLNVKAGQKIAIVGHTGSGKTTLVNLLMRFYELDRGSITIDGVDIKDITRHNVHDLFCMVLQDTWLFNGTLLENIIYNRKDVSRDMVLEACKSIGLHDFIDTMPHKYDTILDDNVSLSAGQKQLITIARAMVNRAPILILDEATSSVDTRTEILIQNAMDMLSKGRTSFVIAHRLSTIRNSDVIIVMKDGTIVEQGTHDELLAIDGYYAELNRSQFEVE